MNFEKIFGTDGNITESDIMSYSGEIPALSIEFTNGNNSVLYGGIGAQVIVKDLDTLSFRNVPMISCKLVEVSTGSIIKEVSIMITEFSPSPIRPPFDKTIKKEIGPLNLETGRYKLDIYALWALIPNPIRGYAILGTGYFLTKNGNNFASEIFEPKQGSLFGEANRNINF